MNKRIKKKRWKAKVNGQTTKKQREANKRICKRFPFLIPRFAFDNKIIWDVRWKGERREKAYSFTLADSFENGWWKAFGLQLCEELREDLVRCDYLYEFRIMEVKEKFGALRVYTGSLPEGSEVWEIIDDYERLSENICMWCGKPDIKMINYGSWLMTICEDCYYKWKRKQALYYTNHGEKYEIVPYEHWVMNDDPGRMADKRTIYRWDKENGEIKVEYDISEKAAKIRARWRKNHHGKT